MRQLSLRLSGLLLVCSALFFLVDAGFRSLEPLCLDQFCVSDFLVFFLLSLHSGQFLFLEHLHSGLFERLEAENVEHGLDLLVKIKQFYIRIEYLRRFAVLLRWHLGLE